MKRSLLLVLLVLLTVPYNVFAQYGSYSQICDMDDVDCTNISDDDFLQYDSASTKWKITTIADALNSTYLRLDGTYPTTGSVQFENYMVVGDEIDPLGLGDEAQGWKVEDGSGNAVVSGSYYPSVTIMGGLPASGIVAQAKSGGLAVVQVRDSDNENPIQIMLNEASDESSLQFYNTAQSPMSYFQFSNATADMFAKMYLDDTNGWMVFSGLDDEATSPGFLFGAEDGTDASDHGLSENDVVISQDFEVNGSSYFDGTAQFGEDFKSDVAYSCLGVTSVVLDGAPVSYNNGGGELDYTAFPFGGDCTVAYLAWIDWGETCGDPTGSICDTDTTLDITSGWESTCSGDVYCSVGDPIYVAAVDVGGAKATFFYCEDTLFTVLMGIIGATVEASEVAFAWNSGTCEYELQSLTSGMAWYDGDCSESTCTGTGFPSSPSVSVTATTRNTIEVDVSEGDIFAGGDIEVGDDLTVTDDLSVGGDATIAGGVTASGSVSGLCGQFPDLYVGGASDCSTSDDMKFVVNWANNYDPEGASYQPYASYVRYLFAPQSGADHTDSNIFGGAFYLNVVFDYAGVPWADQSEAFSAAGSYESVDDHSSGQLTGATFWARGSTNPSNTGRLGQMFGTYYGWEQNYTPMNSGTGTMYVISGSAELAAPFTTVGSETTLFDGADWAGFVGMSPGAPKVEPGAILDGDVLFFTINEDVKCKDAGGSECTCGDPGCGEFTGDQYGLNIQPLLTGGSNYGIYIHGGWNAGDYGIYNLARTYLGDDLIHSDSAAKIGVFGATPIVRTSAYTQTYSSTSRTNPAMTSSDLNITATDTSAWGYSSEAEANAVETELNALRDDVEATKDLVNQLLDDLQAYGWLQ